MSSVLMSIKIVRLSTGEEVLGQVDLSHDDDSILIKNPTHIAISPGAPGQNSQLNIHMAPMLPLAKDKEVVISKSAVLYYYVPVEEIVNKYNSIFGSGIVLPTLVGSPSIEG